MSKNFYVYNHNFLYCKPIEINVLMLNFIYNIHVSEKCNLSVKFVYLQKNNNKLFM